MLEAWGRLDVADIVSFFATDAVYENVRIGAATGQDEIRAAFTRFTSHMTFFDAETVHLAVVGNIVLAERIDHLVSSGTTMDVRGVGVFEVADGKIKAWRDYFPSSVNGRSGPSLSPGSSSG